MKKNGLCAVFACLFVGLLCVFAMSCDDSDCAIVGAEFRSADKIRVFVANWADADADITFQIDVYIDDKRETGYYVKSTSYASWDFYADITINKDIPVGARCVISPSFTSNKLRGSATLVRE